MSLLSEDDLSLRDATWEELEAAWNLWFDLAQHTNADDPPYAHGVLIGLGQRLERLEGKPRDQDVT